MIDYWKLFYSVLCMLLPWISVCIIRWIMILVCVVLFLYIQFSFIFLANLFCLCEKFARAVDNWNVVLLNLWSIRWIYLVKCFIFGSAFALVLLFNERLSGFHIHLYLSSFFFKSISLLHRKVYCLIGWISLELMFWWDVWYFHYLVNLWNLWSSLFFSRFYCYYWMPLRPVLFAFSKTSHFNLLT